MRTYSRYIKLGLSMNKRMIIKQSKLDKQLTILLRNKVMKMT